LPATLQKWGRVSVEWIETVILFCPRIAVIQSIEKHVTALTHAGTGRSKDVAVVIDPQSGDVSGC